MASRDNIPLPQPARSDAVVEIMFRPNSLAMIFAALAPEPRGLPTNKTWASGIFWARAPDIVRRKVL
jgi:hypothetical protein